jgi:ribosomal protein S27AE
LKAQLYVEVEMGMFDTVMVPCPKCGTKSGFQSKGGDCMMAEYELENCPSYVLSDVNRYAPNTCVECGTVFAVRVTWSAEGIEVTDNAEITGG